jgi:hypothetical protein
MSKPATQLQRVALSPVSECVGIWRSEKSASVEVSSYRLLQLPLGAFRVNQAWHILEYRRGSEEGLPETPLGKHLFSVAPWTMNPSFVDTLSDALRSGISNSHFDFKVSANTAERVIHVNIFALGDTTAWLFISDKSLPPL